jgi:Flp pilus assembly pilin Flp
MRDMINKIVLKLQNDLRGQDLVEYALLAGFVAVAGGAVFPATVAPNISAIFSKINSSFTEANTYGS